MSNLFGMDADEVRSLAGRMRSQADAIADVIARVDGIVHQIGQSWHGGRANEFVGWWQRQHRPALVALRERVTGLAQSADNNASQQDAASSSNGSVGGSAAGTVAGVGVATATGVITSTAARQSAGALRLADAASKQWGFVLEPAAGQVPKLLHLAPETARGIGIASTVVSVGDGAFRLGQDLDRHQWQAASNQGTDMIGENAITMGEKLAASGAERAPVVALAGLNVLIWSHVEEAATQVHWGDVVTHPAQLNPFEPGGASAIWQAESAGFSDLGKEAIGGVLGGL